MNGFEELMEQLQELEFVLKEENRYAEKAFKEHKDVSPDDVPGILKADTWTVAPSTTGEFDPRYVEGYMEPEDTHDYGMYDYNEPRVQWSREDD